MGFLDFIPIGSGFCGVVSMRALRREAEHKGVKQDGNDRGRQDEVPCVRRQYFQLRSQAGEDEGKFANLREAGRDCESSLIVAAESSNDCIGG